MDTCSYASALNKLIGLQPWVPDEVVYKVKNTAHSILTVSTI